MKNRRTHRMGQVFLANPHIASIEAEHAAGRNVLEMGSGTGVLTRALLKRAKKVVAVEKDSRLYNFLRAEIKSSKLKLINKDFFDATDEELGLDTTDIMIANVPYSLSSKTIEWLSGKRMQAVLCLQKEFVGHMLARENTREYSRLSVMTALSFRITKILDVPRGNFRPVPLVDSTLIYMKPRGEKIEPDIIGIISALMQHKKRTVRKAMIDSISSFGINKERMSSIMDRVGRREERVFKLPPAEILDLATEIKVKLKLE